MGKEVTKMYALFPRKKTYGLAQSFAWADAKLCVDTCKALRWHMQCFALALAKLCVGTCNALREMMQCFASEIGKNRHRNRLSYSG